MSAVRTVIIDAMSGDNAPEAVVRGALNGAVKYGCDLVFVGDTATISGIVENYKGSKPVFRIAQSDSVLTMEDAPFAVMNEKKDSSLAVAVQLLGDGEGDALVSAANTGALFTAASIVLRRLKGVRRAALGAVVPLGTPFLLLDGGANVDIMASQLLTFARMGAVYAKIVMGVEKPRIGLLNNGTESTKGTAVCREAYELLSRSELDFRGNIEGCDLMKGLCDVVVTDGFTGNIAVKTIEGMATFAFAQMKRAFSSSLGGMIGSLFARSRLRDLKREFDPSRYGGAPLLGITKPVIKAHGAANEKAIERTVSQAMAFADAIEIMKENEY